MLHSEMHICKQYRVAFLYYTEAEAEKHKNLKGVGRQNNFFIDNIKNIT